MKYSFFFCATLFLVSCSTSKIGVVNQVTKDSLNQTLFYALPRNTLEFEIKIKQTIMIRGSKFKTSLSDSCLAKLADRYNVEKDVLKTLLSKDTIRQAVLDKDGLVITQGAKADINKIYAVNLVPKFNQDNITGLTFTQDWLLTEATLSSDNRSFEIGMSAASSLLGVLGLGRKGSENDSANNSIICLTDYKDLDEAVQKLEDFVTDKGLSALLPETYQASKAVYEKKIEELFKQFFYEKKEKLFSVKFTFDLPDKFYDNAATKLFRIDSAGKLEIDSSYLNNIRLSQPDKAKFVNAANSANWYTIKASLSDDDVFAKIKSKITDPRGETGLVFNIPATASIQIVQPKTNAVLHNSFYKFAQFGKLGYLNKKLNKVTVSLDPLTGSLIKVNGESKSVAASQITSATDIITKAHDTFKNSTETEELEKKAKILELKAKIKALEVNE